jgi:putative transcriptional regulator
VQIGLFNRVETKESGGFTKRYINAILMTSERSVFMGCKDILKDIRKRCLLSQSDFADAIGVSFSTVNRWENGRAIPNYKALKRIKEYCNQNNIDFELDKILKENKR